jgi:hypothetical protein
LRRWWRGGRERVEGTWSQNVRIKEEKSTLIAPAATSLLAISPSPLQSATFLPKAVMHVTCFTRVLYPYTITMYQGLGTCLYTNQSSE